MEPLPFFMMPPEPLMAPSNTKAPGPARVSVLPLVSIRAPVLKVRPLPAVVAVNVWLAFKMIGRLIRAPVPLIPAFNATRFPPLIAWSVMVIELNVVSGSKVLTLALWKLALKTKSSPGVGRALPAQLQGSLHTGLVPGEKQVGSPGVPPVQVRVAAGAAVDPNKKIAAATAKRPCPFI